MNGVDEDTVEYVDWLKANQLQLNAAGVPERYYQGLYDKLRRQTFDAGDFFCLIEDGTSRSGYAAYCTKDIKVDDDNAIFLIDHAWTFRFRDARHHLLGLLDRVSKLVNVTRNEEDDVVETDADLCERVLKELPVFAQTYSVNNPELSEEHHQPFLDTFEEFSPMTLASDEQRQPVWYILDEFGARIDHSLEPDVAVVPFADLALTGQAYSLMYPLQDIPANTEITRNYVAGRADYLVPYLLLPWVDHDFSELDEVPPTPNLDYFTVYADDDRFVSHLSAEKFAITECKEDADIWWLREHLHDYRNLSAMVNQFPGESVMTVKDLFAAAVRRSYSEKKGGKFESSNEMHPDWLPITYNLMTELPQFVSCFQRRTKSEEDNVWIVKPWNLARGMDMHVTDSLAHIIRLVDSGPKIVCKYIERPVLFHRSDLDCEVKFDVRFIVIVRSLDPLDIRVYKKFWLRFANKPFTLDRFEDYEKHYTVHNYTNPDHILQMNCDDFIVEFDRQNPSTAWSTVKDEIYRSIRESLEYVSAIPSPSGMHPCERSRSMFGVDVMLRKDTDPNCATLHPVLLEYNYNPDCTRACAYYPEFADAVFECMFVEEDKWTDAKESFDRLC